MSEFYEIGPEKLAGNVFEMIGKQWMLITAGDETKFNTMTASWGGMGVLWSRNVAFCFIRPQRYTLGFVEKSERFTLSFYDEKYRAALNLCGSKSGRDIDKPKTAGLTPVFDRGSVYFKEASTVLVCKKLYSQDFDPARFLDESALACYPDKSFHRMFIGGIETALVKS